MHLTPHVPPYDAAFVAALTGGKSTTRAIPQLAQHLTGLLESGRA